MNNHTETRLTDYALGELDDAQRREVEQQLAIDAEARRAVDDMAALATMLRQGTVVGTDQPITADASLREKLAQHAAAATVTVPNPAKSPPMRGKRTAMWAVAASFAVLITSVGAIAMIKGSADRKASPLAVQFEASSAPSPTWSYDREDAIKLPMKGKPAPMSRYSVDFKSDGTKDESPKSPAPMIVGNGTTVPPMTTQAPIATTQPAGRESISVSAQSLTSSIPQVQTFNYAAGSGAVGNAYTGGTVISGGTIAPSGAPAQPNAPMIHNPVPALITASTPAPAPVSGKPALRLGLSGANTYTGNSKPFDELATDSRGLGVSEREKQLRERGEIDRLEAVRRQNEQSNTEAYDAIVENPFLKTGDAPLSTFSIDVDTASYSNARRFLNGGQLPPAGAVRLEEFINYFTYDYEQPTGDDPFAVTTEAARCPWNGDHVLVRVGLKGKEIHRKERPATNLVFLVDVSGSMNSPNKLPLVRESLKLLVNELGDSDRVAMVVYAGSSGLVLPSTGGDRKQTILESIGRLEAGGSTNGASGISLAYQVAADNFIKGGVNRVVLATDGDFNVGVTNQGDLVKLIETKAKTGVFFSALGYGMGNLKDSTLEKLADKGNGNYAYIDTLAEARKVLVEQMSGTLVTIAKDVKVQIEFNPTRVAAYRLLGYENRILAAQDFNDDKKDAGEIGAGHTVTALYELIPAGGAAAKETKKLPSVDPLKYQQPKEKNELTDAAKSDELLTLKLRYKQPDGDKSKLLEQPLADEVQSYGRASGDFKFASSVAAFGMLLRDSKYRGSATYDAVLELAQEGIGKDRGGYRAEFVELVRKAKAIAAQK